MLKGIVEVQPLDDYRLKIRFEDGAKGTIDVARLVPFSGVFAPLRDRSEFMAVRVNPELGTIYWPSGADLDPDVLYSLITGEPLPTYEKGRQKPKRGKRTAVKNSRKGKR